VEVRIRRSTEATARHLTTTTIDKLHKVIPELEKWGLDGDDNGRDMCAQVVVGDEGTSAYFEVIVNDDTE
jgi:hypothetical protein